MDHSQVQRVVWNFDLKLVLARGIGVIQVFPAFGNMRFGMPHLFFGRLPTLSQWLLDKRINPILQQ